MPAADETYYNVRWMHVLFSVAVFALLATTVGMWRADSRRQWKEYQREYRVLDGLDAGPPAIEQILLPDLTIDYNFRRVARCDRCTTCHQGIDRPSASKLEQPHATHPRLDLFVGAKSPHPMAEFGCTICHDGQGSATDFQWASHTPNDRGQRQRWHDGLGWSANPNWDYPMLARRFSESRCLKCHQDPVELESSPTGEPAAKLMAGYHLVRQYGCFSCHEIPAFGDVRHKVGPSMRNIAGKFNAEYLANRIRNPADVLPSTRMPRLYGLDDHLSGRVLEETRRSEEAEISAVAEYLLAAAEPIELPAAPPGVTERPSAERGRRLFEAQGCLACHRHRDFPKGQATQGPDLSNVGKNYMPGSGTTWLTGWLRDPARYSPQTLMPNPLLRPMLEDGGTDPAADLAAYLMKGAAAKATGGKAKVEGGWGKADFARRTIARRGCAGCHDIPGMENTPPIGPSLRGWGQKSESLLAFERINDFLEKPLAAAEAKDADSRSAADREFFADALLAHRREGFLWQKLRVPRSFDYDVAEGKPIDQQLRMGHFELTDAQREAIATFILAQVEETPSAKYLYHPDARRKAIIEGRKVLAKYACAECHTLELERWTVGSSKVELSGMPRLDDHGVLVEDEDDDGHLVNYFTLWSPAVIDGRAWPIGGADVPVFPLPKEKGTSPEDPAPNEEETSHAIPWNRLVSTRPPWGGALARLLYPVALAEARPNGASEVEVEAWGWVPPALVHEGSKVQPEWLFRFLLDPTPIRPAAVLRMPRFNLSSAEATKLADYFAAVAETERPYTRKPFAASAPLDADRLDRAMRLVLDRRTYCSICHTIGNHAPASPDQTVHAPRLDEVGRRLRPEYVRRWLSDPKSVLPYTAMPLLFPRSGQRFGQDLFPGSSRQQRDAVIELLLRYDEYVKRRTPTPAP